MATLTIRNLDDSLKRWLRVQAADRGVSMEEEARAILRDARMATWNRGESNKRSALDERDKTWHLKASLEDILGLGTRTDSDFDQKKAFDELYDYLDDE